jgi:hypothetical protein
MTQLKLTAVSVLVALVAACEPAQQPIAEAIAQPPAVSKVYYPDPAEGSADGQVFEY